MEFDGGPTGRHGRASWPLSRRLAEKIVKPDGPDGCWGWIGATSAGYGRIRIAQRAQMAHRVVFETSGGIIPAGMVLDHLCRNPVCVNPAHLEPVPQRENILRGEGASARNARKSACKRGHPLSGQNLFRNTAGTRQCRSCARLRDIKYKGNRHAL